MASLDDIVAGKQIIAVVCNQWGDTGKGKFVDYFADVWADLIVRGTGSNNAGHTIRIGDKEYIFHLIPSGILHDKEGKENIIANGVLLNPAVLSHEMSILAREGMTYNGLRISSAAHLTTPDDLVMDAVKERIRGKGNIGTTLRGVGPGYSSKMAREGVRVGHLFNTDEFAKRFRAKFEKNMKIMGAFGITESDVAEIMQSSKFRENGKFRVNRPNVDDIISEYMIFADELKQFVTNTQVLIDRRRREGKRILLEGAQGLLLSIDHGTYPYVTSSDCSASGLASGSGIPPNAVDLVLGIAKMFYMTRVGGGPFPTEFILEEVVNGGIPKDVLRGASDVRPREWEKACYSREATLREIANGDQNALSRYCRVEGGEYGATTGRPRRTGWLDLVALKYAVAINGPDIISTKTDVLDHLEKIKLCVAYEYQGPAIFSPDQGKFIQKGDRIETFPTDPWILENIKPIYIEMDGWMKDTSGIMDKKDLPENMKKIYKKVEELTGANIRIASVGADREQTVIIK